MIEVATASINNFASKPEQSDSGTLAEETPRFRTALELISIDPEQPREIQALEPDLRDAELKAAKEEIARLQERYRVQAEENRRLRDQANNYESSNPKWIFDMLESISMNVLAPALDHEATDVIARDLARDLRTIPDELSWYVNKRQKSYPDAILELKPLLDAAKNKLLEKKKRAAAEGKTEHRAKLLLEKIELRKEIRISQAIDIIDGDEGEMPSYMATRRAMLRVSELSPDVVFIKGSNGGIGSILKKK